MGASALFLILMALPIVSEATEAKLLAMSSASLHLNPIRKVVTMLQAMQTKVEAEGKEEEALYNKFMCYCKNSGGGLGASIAAAEAKIPKVSSEIKAKSEELTQTKDELAQAQTDIQAAKTSVAEATGIREKEAVAYTAVKADYTSNGEAIAKAVAALEKGMGAAFLQTSAALALRKLMSGKPDMLEDDRREILAFLSSTQDSEDAPQNGEADGILKQMGDEIAKSLAEATATEEAAIASYEELMAAKKKEISALQASIETKMQRIGDLSVSIAQMKHDLEDTEEAMAEDKEFLAGLDKACDQKKADWEVRVKTRSEELLALAETIKVLNDDDAVELFKKTLPSAASSFMQVSVSAAAMRASALAKLRMALASVNHSDRARLDVILLALHGKKIGFEKVMAMVDELVASLNKEQAVDDEKKKYCAQELDSSEDKKKASERTVSDEEAAIASAKEDIASLTSEIAAVEAGIQALDKSVAEATENRKEENKEFKELMASDSTAKELLDFAKNRLNQFYNPKLYKAPPKEELSLVQISAHTQLKDQVAPPPPPETFGAYTKKSEETSGVIAMINLLITDLEKEMAAAKTEENDAQADYEVMMKDSAEKRAEDSKSLTEKGAAKADMEAAMEEHTSAKASASKELGATLEYIHNLHNECDWLLQYFDVRKEARASEIDALGKAKAVLSGADYALLQTKTIHRFLRRAL